MTTTTQSELSGIESQLDPNNVRFEDAFKLITGDSFEAANELQQALYPRLITQDTGLLIPTAPGAGRLEAVVVPSLMGMRVDAVAHRLFIVGADFRPLDDYSYRLSKYINNLVKKDNIERTIWLEKPDRPPIARTYLPDGSILNGAADHPFAQNVDIVAMPFSHFRATFFGSGGIHAMPETVGYDLAAAETTSPRGLIYFDDAFGSSDLERHEFTKFVGFLFAQDLDIVVGSSALPFTMREEMAALELVDVKSAQVHHPRSISFVGSRNDSIVDGVIAIAKERIKDRASCAVVFNSPDEINLAKAAQAIVNSSRADVHVYRSDASRAERRAMYTNLMGKQANGEPFVLVTNGAALEASNFDLSLIITEECDPLSLVRRAGHSNRRGQLPNGEIIVVGNAGMPTSKPSGVDELRQQLLANALRRLGDSSEYDPLYWEGFLD